MGRHNRFVDLAAGAAEKIQEKHFSKEKCRAQGADHPKRDPHGPLTENHGKKQANPLSDKRPTAAMDEAVRSVTMASFLQAKAAQNVRHFFQADEETMNVRGR